MMEEENKKNPKGEKDDKFKFLYKKLKDKFSILSKQDLEEKHMHISRTPISFLYEENNTEFYFVYNIDHFKKINLKTKIEKKIYIENFEIFNYVNSGFMVDSTTFIFYDTNFEFYEQSDLLFIEYRIKENKIIQHLKTEINPKIKIEVPERNPLRFGMINEEERVLWPNDRLSEEGKQKIRNLQIDSDEDKKTSFYFEKDLFIARSCPRSELINRKLNKRPKYIIMVEIEKKRLFSVGIKEWLNEYRSFLSYPSDQDFVNLEGRGVRAGGIFGGGGAFEPKILTFYQYFLETKKIKKLFKYLIFGEKIYSSKSLTFYYNYEELGLITVRYLGVRNMREEDKSEILLRFNKRGTLLQKTSFKLEERKDGDLALPGLGLSCTELKYSTQDLIFVNNPNLNYFEIYDFSHRKRLILDNNDTGVHFEDELPDSKWQILCFFRLKIKETFEEGKMKLNEYLKKHGLDKRYVFLFREFSRYIIISCLLDKNSRYDPPLSAIKCYKLEDLESKKIQMIVELNTFKSDFKPSNFRLKVVNLYEPECPIYQAYKKSDFSNKDINIPENPGDDLTLIRAFHYPSLENGKQPFYIIEKKFDFKTKKFTTIQHVSFDFDLPFRETYDYTFFNKNKSKRYIPLYQLNLNQNKLFYFDKHENKLYLTEYNLGGEGIRILIYFDDDLNAYFQTHRYFDRDETGGSRGIPSPTHRRVVTHLKLLKSFDIPEYAKEGDWEIFNGDKERNIMPHIKREVCDVYGGSRKRGHKLTYYFGEDTPVYYIQEFWEGGVDADGAQQLVDSRQDAILFHEAHDYWYQQGHNQTLYRENYLARGGVHFYHPRLKLRASLSFMEKNDGTLSEWKIAYARFIEIVDKGIGGRDEKESLNKYFYFTLFSHVSKLINICRVNAETDDGEIIKQYSAEFVPKRFFGNHEYLFSYITENNFYDFENKKMIRDSKREELEGLFREEHEIENYEEKVKEILRILINSASSYEDFLVYKLKLHEILGEIQDDSLLFLYLVGIKLSLGFEEGLSQEIINYFPSERREFVSDMIEKIVDKMIRNHNIFGRRFGLFLHHMNHDGDGDD